MFKVFEFKKHKEDVYIGTMRVSNSYPVKLKIEDCGVYGFDEKLTLAENIKNLYLNNHFYKVLKQTAAVSIEEVHSIYGEKFLFLRSHEDLILLNYISNYDVSNPRGIENGYIPELTSSQAKTHIANIKFYPFYEFTNYKIINSHDAFKGFPCEKHCYIEKNIPFFKNFIESLFFHMQCCAESMEVKEYNCIDEVINTDKSMDQWVFNNKKFYYYVIDNVYIISDYR